jgi:hypothetical protein
VFDVCHFLETIKIEIMPKTSSPKIKSDKPVKTPSVSPVAVLSHNAQDGTEFGKVAVCSLHSIFHNRLFRIPDYQRGYSWKDEELDDLWDDLMNLQPGRHRYTGVITLESPTDRDLRKWPEELWLLGEGYKPYYVVDGQQRLTTIIILLQTLTEYLEVGKSYGTLSATNIAEQYLYRKSSSGNLICFLFGYEKDDPSYEHLKRKIFKQVSLKGEQPETSYTHNLTACQKFFDKRLKDMTPEQRNSLFYKVIGQLRFDVKVVERDLDIYVVFETMNNRGKELSQLEKLKNRLIYLSIYPHLCLALQIMSGSIYVVKSMTSGKRSTPFWEKIKRIRSMMTSSYAIILSSFIFSTKIKASLIISYSRRSTQFIKQ